MADHLNYKIRPYILRVNEIPPLRSNCTSRPSPVLPRTQIPEHARMWLRLRTGCSRRRKVNRHDPAAYRRNLEFYLQAPSCHILTLRTVSPRLSPCPHVGYHEPWPSQNSFAAVRLLSPQGLLPTPSGKNPFVPPTATFKIRKNGSSNGVLAFPVWDHGSKSAELLTMALPKPPRSHMFRCFWLNLMKKTCKSLESM